MYNMGYRKRNRRNLINWFYIFNLAHDKEVYDISFSPEKNLFASVGADGSCR